MATTADTPTTFPITTPGNNDEFNRRCLKYFKDTYAKRISSQSTKPKPYNFPEDLSLDDILPSLLNDRFFFFSCRMTQVEQQRSNPSIHSCYLSWCLWEIFNTCPEELFVLYKTLRGSQTGESRRTSEDRDAPAIWIRVEELLEKGFKEEPTSSFLLFQEYVDRLARTRAHNFQPQLEQIRTKLGIFLSDLRTHELFYCYHTTTNLKESNLKNAERLRRQLPLYNGFCQYIQSQGSEYMQRLLVCSLNRVPDLSNLPIGTVLTEQKVEIERKKVYLLFNNMGTGETQIILNTMSKRWGFYLMTPNLAPDANKSPANDDADSTAPKRDSASCDTYSAWEDSKEWERVGIRHTVETHKIEAALDANAILGARLALLQTYKDMEKKKETEKGQDKEEEASKLKWALLQVSGSSYIDIFDAVYRFRRLINMNDEDHRSTAALCKKYPFELFVDESQEVLESGIAESIQDQLILLSSVTYLSGSSLKLLEVLNNVSKHEIIDTSVYDNFESVDSEEKFELALEGHARNVLMEAYEIQQRLLEMGQTNADITNHPLFSQGGKPLGFSIETPKKGAGFKATYEKWEVFKKSNLTTAAKQSKNRFSFSSYITRFSEWLLRVSSENKGRLSEDKIRQASTKATSFIEHVSRKQAFIAEDLSRKKTISKSGIGRSIREKFASVKIYRDGGVKSITSVVKEDSKSFWAQEKYTREMLLGEISRSFSGDKLFSVELQCRRRLFNELEGAKNYVQDGFTTVRDAGITLGRYEICGGDAEHRQARTLGYSTKPVEHWLNENSLQRPEFLFPKGGNDPHLLFFLRQRGSSGTPHPPDVLCSIQAKANPPSVDLLEQLSETLDNFITKLWARSSRPRWVIHIFVIDRIDTPGLDSNSAKNQWSIAKERRYTNLEKAVQTNSQKWIQELLMKQNYLKDMQREIRKPQGRRNAKEHHQSWPKDEQEAAKYIRNTEDGFKIALAEDPWLTKTNFVCCIDRASWKEIWDTSFEELIELLKSRG
ncbi:hypothetical protein F4805DRAFT_476317 [Annulohypoxylon moriforme]|nr:hypothetical protein F4805DRAFT_476317 [Annulohypoxylon moriforme]